MAIELPSGHGPFMGLPFTKCLVGKTVGSARPGKASSGVGNRAALVKNIRIVLLSGLPLRSTVARRNTVINSPGGWPVGFSVGYT